MGGKCGELQAANSLSLGMAEAAPAGPIPQEDCPAATTTMPLSTPASEGDTIVSWNIGLRGLRQLVDQHRGSEKVAAKDEHGVSRQLGYGSIGNLLASLGPSVRVVCLQETKLSTRGDLDRQLACPEGWDSFFSVSRAPVSYTHLTLPTILLV